MVYVVDRILGEVDSRDRRRHCWRYNVAARHCRRGRCLLRRTEEPPQCATAVRLPGSRGTKRTPLTASASLQCCLPAGFRSISLPAPTQRSHTTSSDSSYNSTRRELHNERTRRACATSTVPSTQTPTPPPLPPPTSSQTFRSTRSSDSGYSSFSTESNSIERPADLAQPANHEVKRLVVPGRQVRALLMAHVAPCDWRAARATRRALRDRDGRSRARVRPPAPRRPPWRSAV